MRAKSGNRKLAAVGAAFVVAAVSLHPVPGGRGSALAGAPATDVLELRVSFTVRNSNTSGLPCPSDGAPYAVRGLLAGPAAAFAGGEAGAISVYLHGFSTGMFNWSFKAVEGYDLPVEMATLGHASLAIDRLGYDSSGHPNGQLVCLGSGADITHQIVAMLRAGEYEIDGDRDEVTVPPSFSKVVLVGHDSGGGIAEIEAYSYKDIDGLVVWGWAEQGFSQWVIDRFVERSAFCAHGGEAAESDEPGGGYFHWPVTGQEIRDAVGDRYDPRVVDALIAMRNRNPCGDLSSSFTASQLNGRPETGRLGEIDVPVLLIYEDDDVIFTREGAAQQANHFTGTDDLTWVMLEDAGHFAMLELRAGEYRALISDWLTARW